MPEVFPDLQPESWPAVLDQVHDAVIVTSLDGIILTWNAGAERVYGYGRAEMLGRSVELLYSESESERFQRVFLQLEHSRSFEGLLAHRRKDGADIWVHVRISALKDPEGREIGFIGCSNDMTAIRRTGIELEERVAQRTRELAAANQALQSEIGERRRVEAELRHLLDETPGVAYACAPTVPFRLTSLTGNVERLLGMSAAELMADPSLWSQRVHPSDLDNVTQAAARVLAEGSATTEYRYLHADGTYHWICDSATVVREASGGSPEIVGYWLDITRNRLDEQARNERERLRAVAEALIQAQESERRRISRELHDGINQRLALLILEIAELERHRGPAAKLKTRLRALRHGVAEITDDVRSMAMQLHSVRLEQMGLEEALREACASVTERSGIHVKFECEEMPDAIDPALALCVYRVGQEALQNIVRHSHATAAEMHITHHSGGLRLVVADSGEGFVFSPDSTHSGFGIVSMRERITLLNGTFNLETAPGLGTRIEAWLPLAKERTLETESHSAGR